MVVFQDWHWSKRRVSTIPKTSASVSSGFQTRENIWNHEAADRVVFYFIYTEIFASNFAVWKSVSDFTSTNQRGETSFSHVKKIVSSNHKPRFKRILFSRAFSRSSRSLQYLYWLTNLGFAYFVIFKLAVPYLIKNWNVCYPLYQ